MKTYTVMTDAWINGALRARGEAISLGDAEAASYLILGTITQAPEVEAATSGDGTATEVVAAEGGKRRRGED